MSSYIVPDYLVLEADDKNDDPVSRMLRNVMGDKKFDEKEDDYAYMNDPERSTRSTPPFQRTANKEAAAKRKEGDARPKGQIPSTYLREIRNLETFFKNVVVPLANYDKTRASLEDQLSGNDVAQRIYDSHDADDVYEYIIAAFKNSTKPGGLSEEDFERVKKNLDRVREEWKENPEPYIFIDENTGAAVDPDELYGEDKDGNPIMSLPKNIKMLWYHKIGKDTAFFTEKENLAGVMAWWLTAGLVGRANQFDPKISIGSSLWHYIPDGPGKALKGDWTTQKKDSDRFKLTPKKKVADRKAGGDPGTIGSTGRGHERTDVASGRSTPTPIGRAADKTRHGKFTTGQTGRSEFGGTKEESVSIIASIITEDPNQMKMDHSEEELASKGSEALNQLIECLTKLKKSNNWQSIKSDVVSRLKAAL